MCKSNLAQHSGELTFTLACHFAVAPDTLFCICLSLGRQRIVPCQIWSLVDASQRVVLIQRRLLKACRKQRLICQNQPLAVAQAVLSRRRSKHNMIRFIILHCTQLPTYLTVVPLALVMAAAAAVQAPAVAQVAAAVASPATMVVAESVAVMAAAASPATMAVAASAATMAAAESPATMAAAESLATMAAAEFVATMVAVESAAMMAVSRHHFAVLIVVFVDAVQADSKKTAPVWTLAVMQAPMAAKKAAWVRLMPMPSLRQRLVRRRGPQSTC